MNNEQRHKQLHKALEKFEEQFNCTKEATGHVIPGNQNNQIREEEFWINGLIDTPNGLNWKIGGWFRIDTRSDTPVITCTLAVKAGDSTEIGGRNETKKHEPDRFQNMTLKTRYNNKNQEWKPVNWVGI